MKMNILTSSYVSEKGLFLNREQKHAFTQENWLKEAYLFLEVDYPRFHKVDTLSKMTLIANELLQQTTWFKQIKNDELHMLFANANASQQTDIKFVQSYDNQGKPSPSLFVYTLPNIAMGELSIRNKWRGEQTFFVSQSRFDQTPFSDRLYHLACKKQTMCMCMWVDAPAHQTEQPEECFAFLVNLKPKTQKTNSKTVSLHEIKQRLTAEINELYTYYTKES